MARLQNTYKCIVINGSEIFKSHPYIKKNPSDISMNPNSNGILAPSFSVRMPPINAPIDKAIVNLSSLNPPSKGVAPIIVSAITGTVIIAIIKVIPIKKLLKDNGLNYQNFEIKDQNLSLNKAHHL